MAGVVPPGSAEQALNYRELVRPRRRNRSPVRQQTLRGLREGDPAPGGPSRAHRRMLDTLHAACQADLARPRRCADPDSFVAANLPGNPPIRSVDLLPRGYPTGLDGRFVQLRKEKAIPSDCSY